MKDELVLVWKAIYVVSFKLQTKLIFLGARENSLMDPFPCFSGQIPCRLLRLPYQLFLPHHAIKPQIGSHSMEQVERTNSTP